MPAPFGPMSPTTSPGVTVNDTSSTATTPPKRTVMPRTSSSTPRARGGAASARRRRLGLVRAPTGVTKRAIRLATSDAVPSGARRSSWITPMRAEDRDRRPAPGFAHGFGRRWRVAQTPWSPLDPPRRRTRPRCISHEEFLFAGIIVGSSRARKHPSHRPAKDPEGRRTRPIADPMRRPYRDARPGCSHWPGAPSRQDGVSGGVRIQRSGVDHGVVGRVAVGVLVLRPSVARHPVARAPVRAPPAPRGRCARGPSGCRARRARPATPATPLRSTPRRRR